MRKTISLSIGTGHPVQGGCGRDHGLLADMQVLVPWDQLVTQVQAHLAGRTGSCSPHGVSAMLHIGFVQRWFGYSDECMADALFCSPAYREFAGLEGTNRPLPDAQAIQAMRALMDHKPLAAALLLAVQQAQPGDARVAAAQSASDAALVVWFVSQERQYCARPVDAQGLAINA